MAATLDRGWISYNDIELFNSERVMWHAYNGGVPGIQWDAANDQPACHCWASAVRVCDDPNGTYLEGDPIVYTLPDGSALPFRTPNPLGPGDVAPWYDATIPASNEFYGVFIKSVSGIDNVPYSRTVGQSSVNCGGVLKFPKVSGREMIVSATMMASSCEGMEYGKRWLNDILMGCSVQECIKPDMELQMFCPDDSLTPEFFSFPGGPTDHIVTPDSPANSVTGDIDIRVKINLADLAATTYTLLGKFVIPGDQRSYLIRTTAAGFLQFIWSDDGTFIPGEVTENSTALLSTQVTAGTPFWVRVTRDAGTGEIIFYTSLDGVTWAMLGLPILSTIGGIFDSNSDVEIGAHNNGPSSPITGDIYEAQVYDGINGTLVVYFNAANATASTTPWTSSSVAEVWTPNGAAILNFTGTPDPNEGMVRLHKVGIINMPTYRPLRNSLCCDFLDFTMIFYAENPYFHKLDEVALITDQEFDFDEAEPFSLLCCDDTTNCLGDSHAISTLVTTPTNVTESTFRIEIEAGCHLCGCAEIDSRITMDATDAISTPDTPENSVTGDLQITTKFSMVDWAVGAFSYGKIDVGQEAYSMTVVGGVPSINWWDTAFANTISATAPVPFAPGQIGWISAFLDVNYLTTDHRAYFYTSTDGINWTQLGTTVTVIGVASIDDTTSSLDIFLNTGDFYWGEIRDGIGGTIVERIDIGDPSGADIVSGFYTSSFSGAIIFIGGAPVFALGSEIPGSEAMSMDFYVSLGIEPCTSVEPDDACGMRVSILPSHWGEFPLCPCPDAAIDFSISTIPAGQTFVLDGATREAYFADPRGNRLGSALGSIVPHEAFNIFPGIGPCARVSIQIIGTDCGTPQGTKVSVTQINRIM